jgi:hypothetical protein
MARESEYRGHTIRVVSSINKEGKWAARVEILSMDSRGTRKRSLRSTRTRATEAEADAEGLLLAQRWIDAHQSE